MREIVALSFIGWNGWSHFLLTLIWYASTKTPHETPEIYMRCEFEKNSYEQLPQLGLVQGHYLKAKVATIKSSILLECLGLRALTSSVNASFFVGK